MECSCNLKSLRQTRPVGLKSGDGGLALICRAAVLTRNAPGRGGPEARSATLAAAAARTGAAAEPVPTRGRAALRHAGSESDSESHGHAARASDRHGDWTADSDSEGIQSRYYGKHRDCHSATVTEPQAFKQVMPANLEILHTPARRLPSRRLTRMPCDSDHDHRGTESQTWLPTPSRMPAVVRPSLARAPPIARVRSQVQARPQHPARA